MFFTNVGLPAGYGNFQITATPDKDILPDIYTAIKNNLPEPNKLDPVIISAVKIELGADGSFSINNRLPVFLSGNTPFFFECRGISSLAIKEAVTFNVVVFY